MKIAIIVLSLLAGTTQTVFAGSNCNTTCRWVFGQYQCQTYCY